MTARRTPEMSVVTVTPGPYENVRKTVAHLRAQTVRERLELVIVAPSAATLPLGELEGQGFTGLRVAEVGRISSTGQAWAAGIDRATAPVVAFAEQHAYPDPGWAEALLRRHRESWAAVGPIMANANPTGMLSWAGFLLDFGAWAEPARAGPGFGVPPHNSAYKRALIVGYADALPALLEAEQVLHRELEAQGHELYLEPGATTRHLNVSRLTSYVRAGFLGGRIFGAARAQQGGWSPLRRVLYIGGAPLVPAVRLRRTVPRIRRSARHRGLLPRILPALVIGVVAHALGEAVGLALGPGDATRRRVNFELDRLRHVSERDRRLDAATRPT